MNNIEKIVHKMNTLWGATVALFASVFGECWFLFAAFFVLNVVDYITGVLKARFSHTENSNKGLKGIVKKVGYWVVIALAFFIALSFETMGHNIGANLDFVVMLGWFTLATFIINEIRSILENLVLIGVDVPQFLIRGLEVAAEAVKSKTDHDTDKEKDNA